MATGASVSGMSLARALNGRWSAPQPSVKVADKCELSVASRVLWTLNRQGQDIGARQFQAGGIGYSTEERKNNL